MRCSDTGDPLHRSSLWAAAGVRHVLSLVPTELRADLDRVRLRVANYQAFECRDRLGEATGDARRPLRLGDAGRDPESPAAMLRRVRVAIPDRSIGSVVSQAVEASRLARCIRVS